MFDKSRVKYAPETDTYSYVGEIEDSDEFVKYVKELKGETMDKETYYVTQEQLDLIEWFNKKTYTALSISQYNGKFNNLVLGFSREQDKALLRYLGGDTTVDFKVKEQLYRLWRHDSMHTRVYMRFDYGTPNWTDNKQIAFTATEEDIEKWKTPAWEIEKAD